jgi:predicted SprT family Zn-dependent metalloprotease
MAFLMNSLKVPVQTLVKTLNLGTLSLGKCRLDAGDPAALSRMFTLKKNGMDYVGQVRVRPGSPAVRIEVFNDNYFEEFDQSEAAVLDNLAGKVLGRLLKDKELPEAVKTPILEYIEDQEPVSEEEIAPIAGDERDLDKIFERLNQEYFNDKIQARIMWGRDVKSRNKSGFRYGSYDEGKKLIRIHPRLKQDFVPQCVLELTVYHEMCHQFAPSYKKNGTWQSHHPEFKRKEREFKDFKDARNWEKHNWHRLLLPSEENAGLVTA